VTVVADAVKLDTGDTAWLLLSSALVLLMTPGLAFFYGGLNRSKSVLNMMMMSFSSIGLISILWLMYGFSGAFGADKPIGSNAGIIGDLGQYLGTKVYGDQLGYPFAPTLPIPTYVVMAFQMMFAIITVALISGGISDRTKFAGWLVFAAGWFTLAYVPIAHMVWGGGFLGVTVGELDFAGG
jgi:Amt family ammonium transporter